MKTNNKTRIVITLAVAISLAGLVPVGSATHVDTNQQQFSDFGNTAMFDFLTAVEFEFKGTGTGVYGIGGTNQPCPVSILGLRVIQPISFYYPREATNLKAGNEELAGLGTFPLGTPCPIPGTNPDPQGVHVADMNVFGPRHTFSVSQTMCAKEPFWECSAVLDGSNDLIDNDLDVYSCPWDQADFYFGGDKGPSKNVQDNRGVLGGTGLQDQAFSRGFKCNVDPIHAYEYSDDMANYSIFHAPGGSGEWGTDFETINFHDVLRYGDGSAFVVACTSVAFNFFALNTGESGSDEARSYDWMQVLDLGTPSSWAGDLLLQYLGVGGSGRLVEGWNDQGGQNGCPFDNTDDPHPDKKTEFPVEGQTTSLANAIVSDVTP